tara:strand:+ start:690 stop:1844 length:1155 start_codon:yes stop_codon:yes gene_type:complete
VITNNGFGYSSLGGSYNSSTTSAGGSNFGRVVDIILDSFHSKYDDYNKTQSINGVFYRELNAAYQEDEESELRFAFCDRSTLKRIPLKGEIVLLETKPSEQREEGLPVTTKTYWRDIVSIWNHLHHNAYPDPNQSGESTNDFGEYFEEQDKVAPLQAFPGDDIFEGRHGQSIRFNGTKYDSNELIDDSNNGKPLTIISNGQKEPANSLDPVVENIDEDPSSIYLTSDHSIPLTQANEKRDSWNDEPEKADKYKGSQILLNAGRLYFNAKEESILLSGTEAIGANAKTINLDGEDYAAIDAKKIYLGAIARKKEDEPVLLGQTTTDLLEDMLAQFQTIVKGMATAPGAPPAYVAKMIATSNGVLPQIPALRNRLPLLHSKKVFTE